MTSALARALAAAWFAAASLLCHAAEPVQAVPELDLERYGGVWFEIARLPTRAQSRCVGDVTVNYALRKDGRMAVTQRCRVADGSVEIARGRARREAGDKSGARLEVNFGPQWLQWLPLGWSDHWVVAIDPGYEFAVVSDRERQQLWLMSRSPQVDAARLDGLLARLRLQGFAVDRLVRTPHHASMSPWRRVRLLT